MSNLVSLRDPESSGSQVIYRLLSPLKLSAPFTTELSSVCHCFPRSPARIVFLNLCNFKKYRFQVWELPRQHVWSWNPCILKLPRLENFSLRENRTTNSYILLQDWLKLTKRKKKKKGERLIVFSFRCLYCMAKYFFRIVVRFHNNNVKA